MAKKTSTPNYLIILLTMLLLIIGGCTVEQTYKTLVFFFDGVPPINNQANTQQISSAKNIAESLEPNNIPLPEQPKMTLHKPYFERKCELCHTPSRQLIMPLPTLCYQCHKDFNLTYKYVHAPIQSGYCTKCHNQHLAELPKLLLREGKDLCLYCHSNSMDKSSKYHKDIEDASCTVCHNPHGGNAKGYIRENSLSDFYGYGALNNFTSRRLYGSIYKTVSGDIPEGTEVFIQDNNKNFEVIETEKINTEGKFFIDNIKKRGNYTIRLKGEEYDSVKMEIVNYRNDVLCDFGYSKKNKFVYNDSIYVALHNILNVNRLEVSNNIVINTENRRVIDTTIKKKIEPAKNSNVKKDEFAVEFIDAMSSDDKQQELKYCNDVFEKMYANKSLNAYIYVLIQGDIKSSNAKTKGRDIRDYLLEKGIRRSRIFLPEVTKSVSSKDNSASSLKITIIVK